MVGRGSHHPRRCLGSVARGSRSDVVGESSSCSRGVNTGGRSALEGWICTCTGGVTASLDGDGRVGSAAGSTGDEAGEDGMGKRS